MANDFYNNDNFATELQDGTLATAVAVEEKFDEVAAGFTLVNAETDNGITLSNVDVTTRDIPDAIAARANNMLGFDSTGELGLQVRKGTFKGDWTTTTFYYQDDLVRDSANSLGYGVDSIVVANVNHTSGATMVGDTANWVLVFSGNWWVPNSGNAANPMTGPMFVETGAFGYYVGGASDTYGSSFTVSEATGKVTINHMNNGLGSDVILDSAVNGATSLYYNGSKKFETTTIGADLVSDSISVALGLRGSSDVAGGSNIFFENDSEELQGYITNNISTDTLEFTKTNDLLGNQVTMTFHATGLVEFESISDEARIELKPRLSGGDSGLTLYDDSGVARGYMNMATDTGLIGMSNYSAVGVLQSSMNLTTDGNININGAIPTAVSHLTRKDYVDNKFPGVTAGSFTTVDGKTVSFNSDGVITSVV